MARRMLLPSLAAGLVLALAAPLRAEPLDTFRDCDACPEMIELPMGDFVMGAPDDEFRQNLFWTEERGWVLANPEHPYPIKDDGPQNRVIVDIPIAMGKNEITWDEWMACVDDGGCNGYVPANEVGQAGTDEAVLASLADPRFKALPSFDAMLAAVEKDEGLPLSGRYPVVRISTGDANAYVDWLNRKLGTNAYRLPTEAEWEFAARAGTTTRFAQGYEPTPDQANISGNSTELVESRPRPDLRSLPFPVPVDEMDAANRWGLRHMSGNVSELTMSCYTERYLGWSTTSEWLAKSSGENCPRVSRGGTWAGPMNVARAAARMNLDFGAEDNNDNANSFTGFRVLKQLD